MAEETATVETQEVPLGEASMSEYKKARSEGKEVAEREVPKSADASEPDAEKPKEEKPKARGGFQAKIDRLIKSQAAAEERAAAAEKKAAELESKIGNADVQKTEQKADGEPKREDFDSEVAYVKALTRWEVKQELKAEREAAEKEAQAAAEKEALSAYNKKVIEAESQYDDWKEVAGQDIKLPVIVGDAIRYTLKNGPDVVYFLGKNPEICEEMLSVHPLEAVAMAVKISESLEKSEESEEAEEESEVKAEEVEEKPKTKPAPIRPVSSGSSRSTVPLGTTDFATYKKLRAQGRVH